MFELNTKTIKCLKSKNIETFVKMASKLRPMEQDYAENLLKEIAQIKRNNEWNNMFKNAKCKFGEFIIL